MKFYNQAKSVYKNGYIKNKDFLFKEPTQAIRSIKPLDIIDSINPCYYLSMSCLLSIEVAIESINKLVSFFQNNKKKLEININGYLFFIAFNASAALISSALIFTPFIITMLLVPSLYAPILLSFCLVELLFLVKFTFNSFCAVEQEKVDKRRTENKKHTFSSMVSEFNYQMKQEKEDCDLIREALRSLDKEEKASLTDKKINHSEVYKKLEVLVDSDRDSYSGDINSLIYKKAQLQELLNQGSRMNELKYLR